MSTATEIQFITWWKFINAPRRALQHVSATGDPLALVLIGGVDEEFLGNDAHEVTTHVILTRAAYDALVAGQGS